MRDIEHTELTLADLDPGQSAEVTGITMTGEARRRLMDLGFVPGSIVTSLFRSPLGDPTSYRVRGAMIALRNDQADEILVRETPTETE